MDTAPDGGCTGRMGKAPAEKSVGAFRIGGVAGRYDVTVRAIGVRSAEVRLGAGGAGVGGLLGLCGVEARAHVGEQ